MAKKAKHPSSKASILNVRGDAKATQRRYNSLWSVANRAPLFLRRPKMIGTGKSKKRATYKNRRGEEVPIPQKMNRCVPRFPLRVLLSAAAANAAETIKHEAELMHSTDDVTGEATVSGGLPDISRGAELAFEHAIVCYAQTAFRNALAIRDSVGAHKKVTVGSMNAAVKILNNQLHSCTSVAPGVFLPDKLVASKRGASGKAKKKEAKAEGEAGGSGGSGGSEEAVAA